MQLKRVDVNIRRAIRIKNREFRIYNEKRKKTNCLSQFDKTTQLFLITTNLSKTIIKAKYKVAKLITKKLPFKFFNFFEELVLAVVKSFCLFFNVNKKSC